MVLKITRALFKYLGNYQLQFYIKIQNISLMYDAPSIKNLPFHLRGFAFHQNELKRQRT